MPYVMPARDFGPLPRSLDDAIEEVRYWRDLWRQVTPPPDDLPAKFTPKETAIYRILERANERFVPRGALIEAMYAGRDEPAGAYKCMTVVISSIRRKLAKTDWRVETGWGRGYRLVKPFRRLEAAEKPRDRKTTRNR